MRFAMVMMMLTACMTSNAPTSQPGGGHGGGGGGGGGGSGGSGGSGGGGGGGSLPAELVGVWISDSAESEYELDADGFAVFAGEVSVGTGSCISGVALSYEGDASFDGRVLTIVPTDGTQTVETCGQIETHEFTDTQRLVVGLADDAQGPLLSLTDEQGITVMFRHVQ